MKKTKILIATGGTGGHIFPAFAFIEMLKKNKNDYLCVADRRFLNFRSQIPKDLKYKIISSSTLAGNLLSKVIALFKILIGTFQSLYILLQYKPVVVVSFGGYPTFPVMLASRLLRLPIVIHEPNSILGRTSRFFARYATAISLAFRDTQGVEEVNRDKLFYVSSPIRKKVFDVRRYDYPKPSNKSKINILVLGGSQGAKIFSTVIPKAILLLNEKNKARICIHQQCRQEELKTLESLYKDKNIDAEVKPFFDNVGKELRNTHLVIARSGALTVSEMMAVGRPSILVPLAIATDNHQLLNAKKLEENVAAWVMTETQFTSRRLALLLDKLMRNPNILEKYANNAKTMFESSNNSFYEFVKNCVQKCILHDKFN